VLSVEYATILLPSCTVSKMSEHIITVSHHPVASLVSPTKHHGKISTETLWKTTNIWPCQRNNTRYTYSRSITQFLFNNWACYS